MKLNQYPSLTFWSGFFFINCLVPPHSLKMSLFKLRETQLLLPQETHSTMGLDQSNSGMRSLTETWAVWEWGAVQLQTVGSLSACMEDNRGRDQGWNTQLRTKHKKEHWHAHKNGWRLRAEHHWWKCRKKHLKEKIHHKETFHFN